MTTHDECIFCAILAGKAPCYEVFDDGEVKVFMDVFPAADGHLLVVPREHAENIFELPEDAARAVAGATRRAALALKSVMAPDGLTVTQANGVAAGQSVPHFHVHLIPRSKGVKLRFHGTHPGDPERLEAHARAIAAAL